MDNARAAEPQYPGHFLASNLVLGELVGDLRREQHPDGQNSKEDQKEVDGVKSVLPVVREDQRRRVEGVVGRRVEGIRSCMFGGRHRSIRRSTFGKTRKAGRERVRGRRLGVLRGAGEARRERDSRREKVGGKGRKWLEGKEGKEDETAGVDFWDPLWSLLLILGGLGSSDF